MTGNSAQKQNQQCALKVTHHGNHWINKEKCDANACVCEHVRMYVCMYVFQILKVEDIRSSVSFETKNLFLLKQYNDHQMKQLDNTGG